jgi:MFS family permease
MSRLAALRCAGAGFLFNFVGGAVLFSWSTVNEYVTSQLVALGEPVEYSDTMLVSSIMVLTNAGCAFLGIPLSARFGTRGTYMIAATVYTCGLLLPTVAPTMRSYMIGAVLNGLGTGMQYVLAMSAAASWKPDWRGRLNGIAVGGFAIGPVLWNPMARHMINHADHAIDVPLPGGGQVHSTGSHSARTPTAFSHECPLFSLTHVHCVCCRCTATRPASRSACSPFTCSPR